MESFAEVPQRMVGRTNVEILCFCAKMNKRPVCLHHHSAPNPPKKWSYANKRTFTINVYIVQSKYLCISYVFYKYPKQMENIRKKGIWKKEGISKRNEWIRMNKMMNDWIKNEWSLTLEWTCLDTYIVQSLSQTHPGILQWQMSGVRYINFDRRNLYKSLFARESQTCLCDYLYIVTSCRMWP